MARIEMYPESVIEFMREVRRHDDLMAYMLSFADFHTSDFATKLGQVCAFLGMIVDGAYTEEDIAKLCHIAVMKLRDRNKLIISSSVH